MDEKMTVSNLDTNEVLVMAKEYSPGASSGQKD